MKCPGCRISIILITILNWTTGVIVTQCLGTHFPFMGELKHSGPCCWSSHCHMLLFCKTFCAINLSPSFGVLLPNTIFFVFCPMVVVVLNYEAIKKQKRVEKRKHLLTLCPCLFQFLSISQMYEWAALVETGKHKLWIGLVLDPEHGWQWSDAKPFRYLRWSTGRTASQCGSLPLFQGPFCFREAPFPSKTELLNCTNNLQSVTTQCLYSLTYWFFFPPKILLFYTCWYHSALFSTFPFLHFHFQFQVTFNIFPSLDEPDILWLNVW